MLFARHHLAPECLAAAMSSCRSTKSSSSCNSSTGSSSRGSSSSDEDINAATTVASTCLFTKQNVTCLHCKTKAAIFYQQQMMIHARGVLQAGPYRGQEVP